MKSTQVLTLKRIVFTKQCPLLDLQTVYCQYRCASVCAIYTYISDEYQIMDGDKTP